MAGVPDLEHRLPVSAEEDGSQSIPLNDEISLAVPAVTVDDLDSLLSIVTGSDKVACINGAAEVTLGAGAVDGRDRTRVGRGGSSVIMDGDLERLVSGCRDSPYVFEGYGTRARRGEGDGTKVVSDTSVTSDTTLDVLACPNHALSGIVSCEPALTDRKCFDIANPFILGGPCPTFFISILSCSSPNNLEKSGKTIFSQGGISLPLPSPPPSPHNVIADELLGTGAGAQY
jgi:hypothetical protein